MDKLTFASIKRYFRYFDMISFALTCMLTIISLIFVFSATYRPETPYSLFFKKQCFGILSGFILYMIFCCLDYRILQRWGYLGYIAVLLLLLITSIKGSIGMGARRWINLGIIKFQPSELVKLFFPAFFIEYNTHDNDSISFSSYFPIMGLSLLSALLIIKQPDLGTALILLGSASLLLWVIGLKTKFFMIGLLICCAAAPLVYHVLRPYQKKRIAVFLGQGDTHIERYQIEQSKIAIGSGGITGKGLLSGTQNQLLFLPEGRTDFIFAVLCEEWGFLGACFILLVYLLLTLRILSLISYIKIMQAQLLALGLYIPFMLSTIVNIGMVTDLLPVVGIPLPLMSYGITHIWITLASLGWIQGILIRQEYLGE